MIIFYIFKINKNLISLLININKENKDYEI